ncbi:AzlD domain-containing protein [Planctobacterium marinum]|uniref:Transporter n=1 Tax=Planctobacterium marinum TaxID=1631968 RepID=A0AA48KRH4_9ALTE|nr:transporter [Planctobacterium marinum]
MTDILLIAAMAIVTFIPRYLPLALSERIRLPVVLQECLQFVPVAVLTVIIVQSAFFQQGELHLSGENPYLWATLTAFVLARIQSSMLLTIMSGMFVFVLCKWLLI